MGLYRYECGLLLQFDLLVQEFRASSRSDRSTEYAIFGPVLLCACQQEPNRPSNRISLEEQEIVQREEINALYLKTGPFWRFFCHFAKNIAKNFLRIYNFILSINYAFLEKFSAIFFGF